MIQLDRAQLYYSVSKFSLAARMATISVGVTILSVLGKCFILPVTK